MNYGFITKKNIWDWSLKSIKSTDNYDFILLDIITGKEPDGRQIDFTIKTRTENQPIEKSMRILISFVSRYLTDNKITPIQAAEILYEFCLELEFNDQEWELIYHFDNDFYLAQSEIFGNLKTVQTV